MTLLVKYFQFLSGCTLYSNNEISGSIPFTSYVQFLDVALQEHSMIALDESHVDLDSRNFNTNAVKFFTQVIFYFRKLRTTMWFTSPLLDNLDSRVRGVCYLYCKCSKDRKNFYYDFYDLQSRKYLQRYKINMVIAKMIGADFYESGSMVTPLEWPDDQKAYKAFLSELKVVSNDYYRAISGGGGLRPQDAAVGDGFSQYRPVSIIEGGFVIS